MERPAACTRRLAAIASALRPSPSLAAVPAAVKLDADGEPVQRAIPLTAADDPEGADKVGLTAAEVEYFKANVRAPTLTLRTSLRLWSTTRRSLSAAPPSRVDSL